MNKLLEYTENFETSRPIFRLKINPSGCGLSVKLSQPIHKFTPIPIKEDALSSLICSFYNETFSVENGNFTIDKSEIVFKAMGHIRNSISTFLEKNLEMRNPRQSKLYRWTYRNMPNSSDFNEVLIMVYKYLYSFSDSTMKSRNNDHTKNAIAILEAMMEKYER